MARSSQYRTMYRESEPKVLYKGGEIFDPLVHSKWGFGNEKVLEKTREELFKTDQL